MFAVTASLTQENSRAAVVLAFAVDGVLAAMSAHKLERAMGALGKRESRLEKLASASNELQRRAHQVHPSLDRRSFPLPLGIVA
jgi:hypothetical protein